MAACQFSWDESRLAIVSAHAAIWVDWNSETRDETSRILLRLLRENCLGETFSTEEESRSICVITYDAFGFDVGHSGALIRVNWDWKTEDNDSLRLLTLLRDHCTSQVVINPDPFKVYIFGNPLTSKVTLRVSNDEVIEVPQLYQLVQAIDGYLKERASLGSAAFAGISKDPKRLEALANTLEKVEGEVGAYWIRS